MAVQLIDNHGFYGQFKVITHDEGISHHIINNLIWEKHILNIINMYVKENTNFIDIGANIGCHCVGIEKLNKDKNVNIIAFEPQPFIHEILDFNIKRNCSSYECFNVGLGERSQTIYLDMPDYDSCKNPGGFGLNMSGNDHTKTKIQIETLDSYNYKNISVIKIDVEGLENEVLKGSYDTIKQSKPVMIIEILGGMPIEKANDLEKKYINDTITHIKSLHYTVERISFSDYLCKPISA